MSFGKVLAGVVAGLAFLVGITVIFGSWYTVDDGYRGVLLRNGAYVSVSEPGLNFKTPWIEDVVHISIRDNVRLYENFEAYSRDQQSATMRVTVNYRIPSDKVREVYTQYGSEEQLVSRLLDRQVFDKVKTAFGQFNAASAIQDRARLNLEATNMIINSISGPIMVLSVQLEDIAFSDTYERSIEERMQAEVAVQRLEQQAKQAKVEAEIAVTQANARADAVRAEAQAKADAIKLTGLAEAEAIDARGRALRDNPSVIQLTQAEKWNGVLPTSIIPNGTVPILNMGRE